MLNVPHKWLTLYCLYGIIDKEARELFHSHKQPARYLNEVHDGLRKVFFNALPVGDVASRFVQQRQGSPCRVWRAEHMGCKQRHSRCLRPEGMAVGSPVVRAGERAGGCHRQDVQHQAWGVCTPLQRWRTLHQGELHADDRLIDTGPDFFGNLGLNFL